jgi:hypothetical protein
MLTPFRKPEGGELLDWQKEFNKQINKIRYVIDTAVVDRDLGCVAAVHSRRCAGSAPRWPDLTGW